MLYSRSQKQIKLCYSYAAYAKIYFVFVGLLRCNCIAGNAIQGENTI
jgi:hypothetical protein